MEFDYVTNRYLYPDKYIKMIPYFLNSIYGINAYTHAHIHMFV
jgi:hypothetical protein